MNAIFNGFNLTFTKEIVKKTIEKFGIKNAHVISSEIGRITDAEAKELGVNIITIPTKDVYFGTFDWVDFNKIPPLDAETLKDFMHLETEIIQMMSRDNRIFNVFVEDKTEEQKTILANTSNPYYYTLIEEPTYLDRKKIYLNQLRFWLNYVETNKIDIFFAASPPHNNHEFVLYHVLKKKNKPVLFSMFNIIPGSWFISHDFTDTIIKPEDLEATQLRNPDVNNIKFHPLFESEINRLKGNVNKHMFHEEYHHETSRIPDGINIEEKKKFNEKGYPFRHNDGRGIKRRLKKYWRLFTNYEFRYFNKRFGSRENYVSKLRDYYKSISHKPNYNEKYFYFPLHMQPECTSAPLGGIYADQRIIIDMITYYLPDNVYLYIKEHPAQKNRWRSIEYYHYISKNKKVKFIDISEKQNELIKNSLGVVTITGTSALEGLFMGKPAILFGNNCYTTANGVFRIKNNQDCKHAIDAVLSGFKPDQEKLTLYLKALEEKSVFATAQSYGMAALTISAEENASKMADAYYNYYQTRIVNEAFVK